MLLNATFVLAAAAAVASPAASPARSPAPAASYAGLGAESLSPELIASFVAPPLDAAITRPIQSMLDVRGAGSGLLSSTGGKMYFTWKVTGTYQVWRQDGPDRFPVQMTGGEDATRAIGIAPDDSFVLVSRDVGGQENPGLYLMRPEGGALVEVQHTPKVQTTLAFISDDSRSVYFLANDIEPDSYALYRWNVATKKREPVFTEKGLWEVADHVGTRLLLVKNLGNTHQEVFTYDLATKKLAPVIGQNEEMEYAALFGGKPGSILVRTNKLGDFRRLYEVGAGGLVPVSPEMRHDVEGASIDDAHERIYYDVNADGYTTLAAMDAKTYAPLALPKLPAAENTTVASISRNGRWVQLSVDGSTLLPTTAVWDRKTSKLVRWREPAAPEIDVSHFAKVALESYPARDGTPIPMFVRRPAGCETASTPCPVIVEFHGGPEGQATAGFSAYAQMFVDAGFILVEPNVRGSDGYGKKWLDADNGPKRMQILTDIEDCSKFIRAKWMKNGIVPKIGVTGGSYGGYSTLMAMTFFAGAYDAGVEQVGISNLITFLNNTAPYRRILRTSEYGDPEKDHDALVQLSPTTYADRVSAPMLLIQGVNDPRVPVGEAVQFYRALERRGVDRGLILFPDEGHGATKRANQVLAMGHSLAFFRKHLAPAPN